MAPTSMPVKSPDAACAAQSQSSQSSSSTTSQTRRRLLQREGAVIFLTAAEQALEDAMFRLSPPPQVLGKRTRGQDNELEEDHGGDTEPDEDIPATAQAQLMEPSPGNLTAVTLRKPEQLDEIENFCKFLCLNIDPGRGRQSKLFIGLLAVENKIDAFKILWQYSGSGSGRSSIAGKRERDGVILSSDFNLKLPLLQPHGLAPA
ncbi:hypothetical protein BJ912DRAFT_930716 [Pholiota molesta]|nr:hypothetical protein BJ912DRAFT_930716 [Pholiota molesta]